MPNIFQYEALQKLEETNKNKGVVVMPTGTGKTFLASLWFKKQLESDSKAKLLFICHNKDILSQANEKEFQNCLKELDITYGYYNAKEKNIQQSTFATTQTLARNLEKFDKDYFDYIIVDECHHYQAKTFKKVLEYFTPKFMLGLTATPNRMDKLNIFMILGEKVYEAKINDAIKRGLLTKINYYCVDNDIDFSKVKWNGNGYNKKDLNKKICIEEYDEAILKEYKETLKSRFKKNKTICFCATVEHVYRMVKLFNNNGFSAIGLTAKKKSRATLWKGTRDKIIKDFKDGDYDIIFVRDLFNEGVDIPDADSIMMLRPTQSHTIFTQQIGRGLRRFPNKKDVLILDFTGNARRCIINFEVLSEMIGLDISKEVRNHGRSYSRNREVIILNNGCEVRLNKVKMNVLFSQKIRPTKEQIVNEYWELKKKSGKQPMSRELFGGTYFPLYWGSYQNFLTEIGEPFRLFTNKVTKDELIKEYFRVKKMIGKQPTNIFFSSNKKNGVKYSLKKYQKEFGSWKGFLKSIGEPLNQNNVFAKDISEKELIDNLKDLKNKLKRNISWTDLKVKTGSKYGEGKYRSKFGLEGMRKILTKINGNYRELNIPTSKIIKKLKERAKELGHIPKITEFGNTGIVLRQKLGMGWKDVIKLVFGKDCNYTFMGDKTKVKICPTCKNNFKYFNCQKPEPINCSMKCRNIFLNKRMVGDKGEWAIKEYNKGRNAQSIAKEIGISRNPLITYFKFKGIKIRNRKESRDAVKEYILLNKNIKVTSNYKPKTIIIPIKKNRKGLKRSYEGLHKEEYKSKVDKVDIRKRIISKIQDGDNVLLLESPDLSAIKEIEKQDKKPNKIIIPNHLEFRKLANAIQDYKTNLNIEIVNTSVLQYLVDSEEKFDFIWLDYCGAFSYYMKDLDILFSKKFNNIKLVLTYNLFDPAKEDENYYFTRVIDYVLSKNEKNKIRLINDISYRYKKNMYNLGFNISNNKQTSQFIGKVKQK